MKVLSGFPDSRPPTLRSNVIFNITAPLTFLKTWRETKEYVLCSYVQEKYIFLSHIKERLQNWVSSNK